jgi:copper chaperone CopZ
MKIKMLIMALCLVSVGLFAKEAELKVKTNMHCGSCKDKIEAALKADAGITLASADVKSKVVTVKFDDEKTNPENIKKTITSTGFSADDMKAEEKSCDTKSKGCCSTEKKAKKAKKS